MDPLGTGGTPNLYDQTKYSAVLDQNNGIPPGAGQNYGGAIPQGYGGAIPQGYGSAAPQGYGNPVDPSGSYGGEFRQGMPQGYGGGMPQGYGGGMPQGYGGGMPRGAVPPGRGASPGGGTSSQSISATLAEMERLRKSVNTRNFWCTFGFIGLMVFIGIFRIRGPAQTSALHNLAPLIPFVIIGLITLTIIAMKGNGTNQKKLKALYKETFVYQLLNQHFQDVYYNWEQGMDQMLIRNSGVCRLGNRYHSEDYLNAVYHGIRFQQADVTIQYHTSSGRSSHTTTYFQGRMFCFEYPMKQSMAVQIYSKNFPYAGEPASGVQHRKLQLESVDFNKAFAVRALSDHDAFYILTPQMMERLQMLRSKYGSITLVFDRGYVMVGLNTKMDSFDAKLSRPIDYQAEVMRMRSDVAVIEELIQLLSCIRA